MKIICAFLFFCVQTLLLSASPVTELLERIDKGASKKFIIEKLDEPADYFELDQRGGKVVVRGNNYVSIACGINWYLKYYANIHLSWNGMQAKLPDTLPAVPRRERHTTDLDCRYYLNYCTFSYTMAFWDWERWEREIDWMALHGINMPLSLVGADVVWYNVLKKLGYSTEEINNFVAGPAFQAWWLMNNLEGWGGPNSDNWYRQQEILQKKIVKRMREYGIEPVLPGYSGMLPSNAKEKIGMDVQDPGFWGSYRRPAFLQPTDARFQEIATLYYKELNRLFGKANYYAMDPFHEGGSTDGVDLDAAGKAIMNAMKKNNPRAVWVIQAWQANPRHDMIKNLPRKDLLVLDLFSESRPQWGDMESSWKRENGYDGHDWIYCMLLNFGGNVGLHGKMQHVIDEFYKARRSPYNETLRGVGLTMEGSENNPVMYELLCELPWHDGPVDKDRWLKQYTVARYGKADDAIQQAWLLLSNSIYNCPPLSTQQGTHESIFCARPSADAFQVSSYAEMSDYYNPQDVIDAAGLFLSAADKFADNDNYAYDLVDIVRQAVAEKGRMVHSVMREAVRAREPKLFDAASRRFLSLIMLQDELLATRSEFKVGKWIAMARNLGVNPQEKDHYEWNARTLITTWGDRAASDALHDYAHREWNGILRDFYYNRWKIWIDRTAKELRGDSHQDIDWYGVEEVWTKQRNPYPAEPEGECIKTARRIYALVLDND